MGRQDHLFNCNKLMPWKLGDLLEDFVILVTRNFSTFPEQFRCNRLVNTNSEYY